MKIERLTLWELKQHECDDPNCAVPALIRLGESLPAAIYGISRFLFLFDEYRKARGNILSVIRLVVTWVRERPRTNPADKLEPVDLSAEIDARVWAKEFLKFAEAKPEMLFDEETITGWFSNSIMAGYGEALRQEEKGELK